MSPAPNVTPGPGGRISGRIFLTCEAMSVLAVGAPVMIVGNYQVNLCDGTKPCIGFVEVANVKRTGGVFPVGYSPGTVTVEVRGWAVRTFVSGDAIAAGVIFGVGAAGAILAGGAGVSPVGISLMPTTAAGQRFDGLLGVSA